MRTWASRVDWVYFTNYKTLLKVFAEAGGDATTYLEEHDKFLDLLAQNHILLQAEYVYPEERKTPCIPS